MIFRGSSHFRVDIGGDLLYREGGQTDVEVLHSILHQVSQLELWRGDNGFVGSFANDNCKSFGLDIGRLYIYKV